MKQHHPERGNATQAIEAGYPSRVTHKQITEAMSPLKV
jgi:hypothetical protein